jgi:hypothetical protein
MSCSALHRLERCHAVYASDQQRAAQMVFMRQSLRTCLHPGSVDVVVTLPPL